MNERELKDRRRYLERSKAMVSEWLSAIADTKSLQKRLTRMGFVGAAYHTGVAVHYLDDAAVGSGLMELLHHDKTPEELREIFPLEVSDLSSEEWASEQRKAETSMYNDIHDVVEAASAENMTDAEIADGLFRAAYRVMKDDREGFIQVLQNIMDQYSYMLKALQDSNPEPEPWIKV